MLWINKYSTVQYIIAVHTIVCKPSNIPTKLPIVVEYLVYVKADVPSSCTYHRRRVPIPSSCLLCTNYSSNHYMQQSTAIGEPLRTSLLLLYVIREIGFVDGFRWNFPALSSTWPRYSSEYCKTYNNYGTHTVMMYLVSPGRSERVRDWWTYVT